MFEILPMCPLAACAAKRYLGLCKKAGGRHLAADAAKQYFERTLFSLILLRKINENSVRSKYPFAAEGGKRLFTTTPKFYFAAIVGGILFTHRSEKYSLAADATKCYFE